MTARVYEPVRAERPALTVVCPDCGSVVLASLRGKHDQLHEQVAALIDTTHRQATQADRLGDALDRLEDRLEEVRRTADYADTLARRAEDSARDAGYRADDAKRAADDAARNASRGW